MTFWWGLIIDLRKTYNAAEGDKCLHDEECLHAIAFKDCTAGQIELEMPTVIQHWAQSWKNKRNSSEGSWEALMLLSMSSTLEMPHQWRCHPVQYHFTTGTMCMINCRKWLRVINSLWMRGLSDQAMSYGVPLQFTCQGATENQNMCGLRAAKQIHHEGLLSHFKNRWTTTEACTYADVFKDWFLKCLLEVSHEGIHRVACPGTGYRLWEFTVMQYGLTGATKTCQRALDKVLEDCKNCVGQLYGWTIVFCDDMELHIADLRHVLSKLQAAGFTLRGSKCFFFYFIF